MDLIPITERLPEIADRIILYFFTGKYSIGYYNGTGFKTSSGGEMVEGVTHWAPLPELPKKKRWMPEKGDKYWGISPCSFLSYEDYWADSMEDNDIRNLIGVYSTSKEAEAMRAAIKAFITEKIGEV